MVPLALADRLSLAPSGGADGHAPCRRRRRRARPPTTSSCAAIAEARRVAGPAWVGAATAAPALAARLEKRIPVAAGLGGGSSDGAAALDGALEAWGAEAADRSRRARPRCALGSDVPFFLAGGPALVEGRGERVDAAAGAARRPAGRCSS